MMQMPMAPQLTGSQVAGPQRKPAFPQDMGPGFPPEVQGFPQDYQALQMMMEQGYAPGATPMAHAQAVNAHALARAQERIAAQQLASQAEDEDDQLQLGEIMQRLMARRGGGAPPTGAGAPPQL